MSENTRIWEIRVGLYATERQAADIQERIARVMCPDPDHAPPCPVPWSASLVADSALEDPEVYRPLVEQARIEGTLPG